MTTNLAAKDLATPIRSPRKTRQTAGLRTAASRSCSKAPAPDVESVDESGTWLPDRAFH
jgi:hypothetical protein